MISKHKRNSEFTLNEILASKNQCNFNKVLGSDGFDGNLLTTNKKLQENISKNSPKQLIPPK
jgi:hypothetical protein